MSGNLNPRKFIPELDGLRAFAILAVLAAHSWNSLPSLHLRRLGEFGWVGVDLFFVLSGFLITGILLDAANSARELRSFYLRRALRIWPLYYGLLILVFAIAPHSSLLSRAHEYAFSRAVYRWEYYAFYLQNIKLGDLGPFPLAITWSLAVEEHFYLLWPLVARLCSRKMLTRVVVGLIAGAPLFRMVAQYGLKTPDFYLYSFTLCRLDGLAWGALLALYVRSEHFSAATLRRWCARGGAVLAVVLIALITAVSGNKQTLAYAIPLLYPLLAAAFAALVGLAFLSRGKGAIGAVLSWRPLTYMGKISYGIYILHPVVLMAYWNTALHRSVLRWSNPYLRDGFTMAVEFALALAAASVSWFVLEKPILRLKDKVAARGPRSYVTATAATPATTNASRV